MAKAIQIAMRCLLLHPTSRVQLDIARLQIPSCDATVLSGHVMTSCEHTTPFNKQSLLGMFVINLKPITEL